ncbi:MAG: molybdopterin molybdotransferase MoeA [Opitutaceae bacterium]
MIPPAEAERLILEAMRPLPMEECPLGQAHGRILRSELRADRDLPPFDRVAMDGYALRCSDLARGDRRFKVLAVQAAGASPIRLDRAPGACVETMTGAVLPEGADCIVPYEEASRDGDIVSIGRLDAARPGQAIHPRGSDRRGGDPIVPPGVRLTGVEIAIAAACGYATMTVSRSPRIGIVATGDELVEVGGPVAPHQIRRSNDYALRASLAAAGYPWAERFHARDDAGELEHLLWHILAEYDAVVLTGGVSRGRFDHVPQELERQGVRGIVHGIAQRPGKPFWFGVSGCGTPVFGLPGNPVSSYCCLHRYVVPALDRASGLEPGVRPLAALAATHRSGTGGRLASLLPVRLSSGAGAELEAAPAPGNTSGDFAGLAGTGGFLELPAGPEEFAVGYCAPLYRWF